MVVVSESRARYIVFISYFYPPSAAVGGLRVQGFASRVAARSGDSLRSIVVTVGGEFEWSTEAGVEVLRCPDVRVRFPVPRRAQESEGAAVSEAPTQVSQLVRRALRRVANDVLIPDEQALCLVQRGRIAKEVLARTGGAIAAVVASTPPPSGLYLARHLSAVSGAPFIADYRDSWVKNPHWARSEWRVWLDGRLQARLMRDIDLVISPSPAVNREFPDSVQLLTGFDERDADQRIGTVDPGMFALLHAGQLYGDRRDPRPVIRTAKLLSDMNGIAPGRLKAVFVGDDAGLASKAARAMDLDVYCDSVNSVPPVEAKAMMLSAGALISLSWDGSAEEGAIPGKIFEYMATGRPTVAFGGSAEAVGELLSTSGAGIHADTPEDAARFLDPYVRAWLHDEDRRTQLTPVAVSKARATDALLEIVDALNSGRRS